MISAKIVADSLSPQGHRLTTFVLTFPRIILAELNTHRMFSRNSASSRAIPFEKMVKSVEENPFIPIAWQKDHKGMQGTEYIVHQEHMELREKQWLLARDYAIEMATSMNHKLETFGGDIIDDGSGVTKQLCNRLLEPFMWHTVILTSSEEGLENFFKQRCPQYKLNSSIFRSWKDLTDSVKDLEITHKMCLEAKLIEKLKHNKGQSEIHMMALAEAMWDAYNESTPKQLQAGDWHIPFVDEIDANDEQVDKILDSWINDKSSHFPTVWNFENLKIKVSTARCARVSYTVVGEDKQHTIEDDLKLHDKLIAMYHMSPLEHIAKAMSDEEYENFGKMHHISFSKVSNWAMPEVKGELIEGWCNNLHGFIPYRYIVENK